MSVLSFSNVKETKTNEGCCLSPFTKKVLCGAAIVAGVALIIFAALNVTGTIDIISNSNSNGWGMMIGAGSAVVIGGTLGLITIHRSEVEKRKKIDDERIFKGNQKDTPLAPSSFDNPFYREYPNNLEKRTT